MSKIKSQALEIPPEEYFERFDTKPVDIKPFNPKARDVAEEYIQNLREIIQIKDILLRGSTAFEIWGKGDIEIGIYPNDKQWFEILKSLINHYKGIGNLEKDYARFNEKYQGFEIEIILMRGVDARIDKKQLEFMKNNRDIAKEYESIKREFAYSRREYERKKKEFLCKVARTHCI
jgi:hypothetical protein